MGDRMHLASTPVPGISDLTVNHESHDDACERVLRYCLRDLAQYSRWVVERPLRTYQTEIGRAVLESIRQGAGRTFTVMLARQMGKNELSAHLEAFLLTRHQFIGGTIVKAAPTFCPQVINSKLRLEGTLETWLTARKWRSEQGYMVRLGKARCLYFSASPGSNVVGATASLLLEIDEAQDVGEEKYSRDFRPMASTTNATTVLYGTAWGPDSLLAKQRDVNVELERRDGIQRNFRYDWTVLAALSPSYGAYVSAEIARLGADHPAIMTQYLLQEIDGEGRFFSTVQRAQLAGLHERQRVPRPGTTYVAGVDLAGADETASDAALRAIQPRRDSTVVTIAEVTTGEGGAVALPCLRVVEQYWWTGRDHLTVAAQLQDLLFGVWNCRKVVVDATGVASWLTRAPGGHRVEAFAFSRPAKSDLAYELLGQINTGRFKMYAADDSAEHREWLAESERTRYQLYANNSMDFYVPDDEGHDDFVTSAALCAWAARGWVPPAESRTVRPKRAYTGEGRF